MKLVDTKAAAKYAKKHGKPKKFELAYDEVVYAPSRFADRGNYTEPIFVGQERWCGVDIDDMTPEELDEYCEELQRQEEEEANAPERPYEDFPDEMVEEKSDPEDEYDIWYGGKKIGRGLRTNLEDIAKKNIRDAARKAGKVLEPEYVLPRAK